MTTTKHEGEKITLSEARQMSLDTLEKHNKAMTEYMRKELSDSTEHNGAGMRDTDEFMKLIRMYRQWFNEEGIVGTELFNLDFIIGRFASRHQSELSRLHSRIVGEVEKSKNDGSMARKTDSCRYD